MSQQWLWRTAGEVRGPLNAADLAELLRSRDPTPVDEVQPVGATVWTPAAALADVVSADTAAADAAADLLLAADELHRRTESATGHPTDTASDRSSCGRRRQLPDRLWSPRALLIAALLAPSAWVILPHVAAAPTNAAVYAELSRWHAGLANGLDPATSAEDERRRQTALQAIQRLIADLESAAQLQPLLSISDDQAAADAIRARRELLFAARDLAKLMHSNPRPPALDRSFRQHLEAAAGLLSLDPMSPGHESELPGAAAPPLR